MILLLSDLLSHQGTTVLLPRLLDSAIGCAITLVAGYLLWPESWHTRLGARLADTVEDCARYLERSFTETTGSTPPGHLRRSLYRDLSAVRTECRRALSEPPPTGRTAAQWSPVVAAVERVVDVTTAVRVQVTHGAPSPASDDVARLAHRIRLLAEQLRKTSSQPPSPDTSVPVIASPVLQPLHREVAALEAVT